ncbi:MAG: ParB/RepB/Spo0J family partition protein [Candidatus Caldarchaeum sp.]
MRIEKIEIQKISVGQRFRQDLGKDPEGRSSLAALEKSIRENGLLHPLVVAAVDDGSYRLLAGHRRLEACKNLGWKEVPCHVFPSSLTSLQRRIIELIENFDRKDLTWQEEVRLRAEIDRLQKEVYGERGPGRPRKDAEGGWSTGQTAELLGVTERTIQKDTELLSALEAFPEIFKDVKTREEAERKLSRLKAGRRLVASIGGEETEEETMNKEAAKKLWRQADWTDYHEKIRAWNPNLVILLKRVSEDEYEDILSIVELRGWIVAPFEIPNSRMIIWTWPVKTWTDPQILQENFRVFYYAKIKNPVLAKIGRSAIFSFKQIPQSVRTSPDEVPIEFWEAVLDTFCWQDARVWIPYEKDGNVLLAALNLTGRVSALAFGEDPGGYAIYCDKIDSMPFGAYTSYPLVPGAEEE